MARAAKLPTAARGTRSERGGASRRKHPLRSFTIWVALPTVAVFFGVCGLVLFVLHLMSAELDAIEDSRSRTAVRAAIGTVVQGLGSSVADEATWTEAYMNTYVAFNPAWLDATWGSTARISQNYDTALVTDIAGNIVFGESSFGPVTGTLAEHYSAAEALLAGIDEAVNRLGDDAPFSAISRSSHGPVAVAGAVIHGNTGQASVPRDARRILWLARQIDQTMLATTAEHFNLPHLEVVEHLEPGHDSTTLTDAAGNAVATIGWSPRRPGDAAFNHIAGVATAIMLVIGLCMGAFLLAFRSSIMRRAESEERDWYSVRFDDVTGLYNRFGLSERLRAYSRRKSHAVPLSALCVGLEGFSEVLGLYGRETGDQLLDAMADRLETLCPADVDIARIGPADFAIVAHGPEAATEIRRIAAELLAKAAEPVPVETLKLKIGVSIGVVDRNVLASEMAELLRHGETALTRARDTGGNHMVEYDSSIEDDRRRRLEVQAEIRRGLDAGEFDLDYQPIVDFASSSIVGVEALMRWTRRPGGPIGPAEFIPAAESSGLIEDLGMFALNRALEEIGPLQSIKISVNVSPVQLRNPKLPAMVFDTLQQWGVEASRLQLEVTETFLVAQPQRAKQALEALRSRGIIIALDDFGTGYSSIGYLRQFRFDRVKLDRSLVADIDRDSVQAALVESTMTYAFAMDLAVTAEGVERREEAVVLSRLGCREFQGYLFAKPVSIDLLRRLLTEQRIHQSESRRAS